jgi:hypothetical protein
MVAGVVVGDRHIKLLLRVENGAECGARVSGAEKRAGPPRLWPQPSISDGRDHAHVHLARIATSSCHRRTSSFLSLPYSRCVLAFSSFVHFYLSPSPSFAPGCLHAPDYRLAVATGLSIPVPRRQLRRSHETRLLRTVPASPSPPRLRAGSCRLPRAGRQNVFTYGRWRLGSETG